jgi:hypothetical protein
MRKLIIVLIASAALGFVGIADGLAISNQQNGDAPVPRDKPKVQQKAADPCSQAAKACWDRCGRVFSEPDRVNACKTRCDNDFVACRPSGNVPRAH